MSSTVPALTARFVFAHPAHAIALGLGAGLAPWAPGTVGTLLAIPIAAGLWRWAGDAGFLLAVVALFVVGAWAAERTGRDLGDADHGAIVIDEVTAFLLVLFFTGPAVIRIALAFALFRLFDIAKPPPIRNVDARFKGGFGVMFDDLIAAGFALVAYALLVRFTGWPA